MVPVGEATKIGIYANVMMQDHAAFFQLFYATGVRPSYAQILFPERGHFRQVEALGVSATGTRFLPIRWPPNPARRRSGE